MPRTVAFILKGYPRLSETFIAQEILALERSGLNIRIISLRHPTDRSTHAINSEISAAVDYLPEYLHHEPRRVLRAWWRMRRSAGYSAALSKLWGDFKRDRSRNRLRRFGQAIVLASELPGDVCHLHSHFLHTPASVTYYASVLLGLPWSASAHAKDIWTSAPWELRDKLCASEWTVTCTAANCEYLQTLAPSPGKVELVYHGLDLTRFPEPAPPVRVAVGSASPCRILSVGRAVPKKGYACLLEALALLPAQARWSFVHIGGGELLDSLKTRAAELGIAQHITWLGAREQRQVLQAYSNADVFVLASMIADDGDRDGLPNVLMEAQSQRLACVATRVSAIPELIEDGDTGLLVEPDNARALSAALMKLIDDVELRTRLARGGYQRVRTHFSLSNTITSLIGRFKAAVAERRC